MSNKKTELAFIRDQAIKDFKARDEVVKARDHKKCMSLIYKHMKLAAKDGRDNICIAFLPNHTYLNNRAVNDNTMVVVEKSYVEAVLFKKTDVETNVLSVPRKKKIGRYSMPSKITKDLEKEELKVKWKDLKGEEVCRLGADRLLYKEEIFILFISWAD